jgi:hypothetical protein
MHLARGWASILLLSTLSAHHAIAQERPAQFKADVKMTNADGTAATGVMYFGGTKMRTELAMDGQNVVVLADPAVSRKHAGIRKVDANYELADLGSTNGVYVNGHKVPKKTLEPGDIIRVGNTEAVFKRE